MGEHSARIVRMGNKRRILVTTRETIYVTRNIQAPSRNHCCSGKAKSITYFSVCAPAWVCVRACMCEWVHGRCDVFARV